MDVIDPQFIYVGALISLSGAVVYVRDTWRGSTAPNRVTWFLWGLEPLLVFGVERQQHIGLASLMTLLLGIGPIVVLAASFHDPLSVWKIGRFDIVCGCISIVGLGVWFAVNQSTVALISFVAADAVASAPTLRKAILQPLTESWWTFCASGLFAAITLLTLRSLTTAGALFPISVLATDAILAILIVSRAGPRVRETRRRRQGLTA